MQFIKTCVACEKLLNNYVFLNNFYYCVGCYKNALDLTKLATIQNGDVQETQPTQQIQETQEQQTQQESDVDSDTSEIVEEHSIDSQIDSLTNERRKVSAEIKKIKDSLRTTALKNTRSGVRGRKRK